MPRPTPPEVVTRILADLDAGASPRDVSARYGVHEATVHRHARLKAGGARRPQAYSDEVKASVLADFARDGDLGAIEARYGLNRATVYAWARRASVRGGRSRRKPADPLAEVGKMVAAAPVLVRQAVARHAVVLHEAALSAGARAQARARYLDLARQAAERCEVAPARTYLAVAMLYRECAAYPASVVDDEPPLRLLPFSVVLAASPLGTIAG